MHVRFSPLTAVLLAVALASPARAQTAPASGAQPASMAEAANARAPALLPEASPDYVAVAALVDALRLPEVMLDMLKSWPADTPALVDFNARFLAQADRDDMRRRATRFYLMKFNKETADTLTPVLRSPAGGRAAWYLSESATPGKGPMPPPDAQVLAVFGELARSKAGKMLIDAKRDLRESNYMILREWRMEYAGQLLKPSMAAMVAARQARLADITTEPVRFVPPPSGVAYVDAVCALMGDMAYRSDHGVWQLEKELGALGIDTMLTPKTLADTARLPQRRAALDKIEVRIEQYLAQMDASLAAYGAALEAVDMPFKPQFMRGAQKGLEQQYAASARVAENQRATLDVIRRMLAFAESRKGKIRVRKGELVFTDDADRLTYSALFDEAQREGGRNDALRADVGERLQKAADVIAK